MITPWKPVQGHLGRRGLFTIRSPHFLVKARGVVVGAIQCTSSDTAAFQVEENKPTHAVGSAYYHLTNYGKGWKLAEVRDHELTSFRSAAFFHLGPDFNDLIDQIDEVEKVRDNHWSV